MTTYDSKTAQVHVFTEKEGLLSAMAHDLELAVTSFTVKADEQAIEATFDARSLKVLHPMKDGRPSSGLSEKDRADIEKNIVKDVLGAEKHPQIRFVSSAVKRDGATASVTGTLTLHGVSRPLSFTARSSSGAWVAEVPLHQPDYGIKPFSAMMGTLKIKPGVRVRITLPAT